MPTAYCLMVVYHVFIDPSLLYPSSPHTSAHLRSCAAVYFGADALLELFLPNVVNARLPKSSGTRPSRALSLHSWLPHVSCSQNTRIERFEQKSHGMNFAGPVNAFKMHSFPSQRFHRHFTCTDSFMLQISHCILIAKMMNAWAFIPLYLCIILHLPRDGTRNEQVEVSCR